MVKSIPTRAQAQARAGGREAQAIYDLAPGEFESVVEILAMWTVMAAHGYCPGYARDKPARHHALRLDDGPVLT